MAGHSGRKTDTIKVILIIKHTDKKSLSSFVSIQQMYIKQEQCIKDSLKHAFK